MGRIDKEVEEMKRVLRTSEYRAMTSWHDKAARLDEQFAASSGVIGRALGQNRATVFRTIQRARAGRQPGVRGRPTLLTEEEEDELLTAILAAEMEGRCMSPSEVKVQLIVARSRGDPRVPDDEQMCPVKIGNQWATDFIRRHGDVIKTGPRRKIDDERAKVPKESLEAYFEMIRALMAEHKYPEWAIANMDETMLKVDSNNRRAVFSRSQNAGYVRGPAKVGHITLVVTIFADGTSNKPLVILENKNLPKDLSMRVAESFSFAGQSSGWMTKAIFKEWVEKVFVPEVEEKRAKHGAPDQRVLLLVDGHASRACYDALRCLASHNIDAVTPVSHSSHIVQPLDLRFFAVFKQALSGMRWRLSTQPLGERRNIILNMAVNAIYSAQRPDIVRRSFQLSGIWPFDPSVPLENKECAAAVPFAPTKAPLPKTPTRGADINERVLTSPESIALVVERQRVAEEKKKKEEAKAAQKNAPSTAQKKRKGQTASANLPKKKKILSKSATNFLMLRFI